MYEMNIHTRLLMLRSTPVSPSRELREILFVYFDLSDIQLDKAEKH